MITVVAVTCCHLLSVHCALGTGLPHSGTELARGALKSAQAEVPPLCPRTLDVKRPRLGHIFRPASVARSQELTVHI